ncbi:interleukin-20 receptor subunit beta isoform X3 [Sciurus carolinensis]|uniref:interleukin-20 receptor subunit beta isoform X3 n=1 Tax=Sciurus carolinensis TaxID=30640 RepID=UPI001FB3F3CD|nr:interleukin-20 receptor subunit beta isoform X3 [Sciurus carolinensis]
MRLFYALISCFFTDAYGTDWLMALQSSSGGVSGLAWHLWTHGIADLNLPPHLEADAPFGIVGGHEGMCFHAKDGVASLPAPQNLSVHSTNMKHFLTWSPVILPGETVHYSVEYQGEYESLYMSHVWIHSSGCLLTEEPKCDLTDDITATVPYQLRVRATLGSQTSAWSTLKRPFNRNSTILTPPRMEVSKDGFHLVIELEDLGPQFEFRVAYWRREPGAKEQAKVVRSGGVPVHLETMDPGATYCVKAQSLVKAIGRCSAFSQAECVEVQGEALPLALALFAFVGFMLILVVVPLSIWKMGQLLRYSCCPAVVLPDTLKITNSPQKLISCRREEVDVCATAVLSSEELFRAWI